ncbi:MAG: putative Ig domain-containing protein [Thermoleophilia bacterium]
MIRTAAAVLAVMTMVALPGVAGAQAPHAPIVVTSTADTPDLVPGDGRCDTGDLTAAGAPACTLRAAIQEADATPGPDAITIDVSAWEGGAATVDGALRLTPATPYPQITDELSIDGSQPATGGLLAPHLVLDGRLLGPVAGLSATAPVTLTGVDVSAITLAGPFAVAPVETPPAPTDPAQPTTPEQPGTTTPDPATPDQPGTTAPAGTTSPADPGTTAPPPLTPAPVTPPPLTPAPLPDPAPVAVTPRSGTVGPFSRGSITAVVNSGGDAPDAEPGDGVCATGVDITITRPECTLRAAIQEANASPLVDTVHFDIPISDLGSVQNPDQHWVIQPTSPLPAITTPMRIDAAAGSDARCATGGAPPAPTVTVDASAAGTPALRIASGGVVVRGLGITGAATAVRIDGAAGGSTLTCDVLGTDGHRPDRGLVAAVRIDGSPGNLIGGTGAGNQLGIGTDAAVVITGAGATGNTVIGNTTVGTGQPVDLGRAGPTANDAGDADRGANGLLNHPELTSLTADAGKVTATVQLDVPAGRYLLEVAGTGASAVSAPRLVRPVTSSGGISRFTVSLSTPTTMPLMAALTSAPAGGGLGATSEFSAALTPMSVAHIAGSVVEDVNGNGAIADDGVGVAGVQVWVFADQGNGVPDAGDPVAATTTTDGAGGWSVTVPGNGTYWAAVNSRDIAPAAGLRPGFTQQDVWAEQTYSGPGAVTYSGGSYRFSNAAGALPGGMRPTAGDGFPALAAAEHVNRVVLSGTDVNGVTTGFSFNAVTSTLDDPAAGAFGGAGAWSSFDADAAGIGVKPVGYKNAVSDGRYVYFAPSQRPGGRHGEVLRYDTTGAYTAASSWSSYDAGDDGVGTDPDGYSGAVFDGRYVYFIPEDNGSGPHAEVLRYDTTGAFGASSSWDAFDPGDYGVGTDPDGYSGASFDGRYLYLAPSVSDGGPHGQVLRYDTHAAFTTPGGWSTFDPAANGVGSDARGFSAVLFDGRYMYFAPLRNTGGASGEVLRYDTQAAFGTAGSWTAFDPSANGVGTHPAGFGAMAWDGRYVYFAPTDSGSGPSGEVLRLDTTGAFAAAGSWSAFDPGAAGLGAGAVGFRTATYDGRYLYLGQDADASGAAGRVVRYDTRAAFGAVGSWDLFDPGAAGVGTDPDGARGSTFDGRYLYLSHFNNGTGFTGEVLRYDTMRTGQGTLRRFIQNANAINGTQSSAFDIPASDPGHSGSPVGDTITLRAPLPAVLDPTTLDATTQPGAVAQGRPVVALDGTSAGGGADGLTLAAGSDGSQVRGLAVRGFGGNGILSGSAGNTIAGDWLGLAFDGATAAGNGGDGLRVTGDGNVVGGPVAGDRNVASGNGGAGVRLAGTGGTLHGNRLGTVADGTAALPNADGVVVTGSGNRVGGPGAGQGNLISGNTHEGVSLTGGGSGTTVQGNLLGVAADGTTPLPNGRTGVWVDTDGNTVGGATAAEGNTVAHNGGTGVLVNGSSTGTAVLGNDIFANAGLGIDLSAGLITPAGPADGITPNDLGDGDTGANGLLNTPVIGSVIDRAGTATATFTLDVPAGTYRVEFFANPGGTDPSGAGEGQVPVGAATVVHAGGGAQVFAHVVPGVSPGDQVTATATRDTGGGTYGSTSEFSAPASVDAWNDPPVNTLPAPMLIAQYTPITFVAGSSTELSVADSDAGTGNLTLNLTLINGTLSLSGTAGLSFTTGDGTADAAMTFSGTLTDINAALNDAVFTPTGGFTGAASLQMATDDQGNTGLGGPATDTDTLPITVSAVNRPPVNTLPAAQAGTEDTPLVLSTGGGNAISVADPDAGAAPVQVTLTATQGTLTLSGSAGLTFTTGDGVGDATMTFTGAQAAVNAALDGMAFDPTPDASGPASIRVITDDQGNTGAGGPATDDDTLAITLAAVNDPPVATLPAPITTPGGSPLVLAVGAGNGISVADPDIGTAPMWVQLSATHGTLTLNGTANLSFIAGDGTVDTTMTFTGTRADVNAALDGMTYLPTPGYAGGAGITVTASDQGATGAGGPQSDTGTLALTILPAPSPPSLASIGPKTLPEGTTLAFTASATDPDLPADTLTYSLVGAPAGASIDPVTGAFTWTPSEAQGPADHTLAVVVTDADSPPASDSEIITVTVTEVNRAPVLSPLTDRTSGEGDAVSLPLTALDPDIPDQPLTWSATGLPPGLAIDPTTGVISGTIPVGAAAGGPYTTTVTVTDPGGLSDRATFAWTVVTTNGAPVLGGIATHRMDEQTPLRMRVHATDPQGDAVRYSLRGAPGGMRIDATTGLITWTPTEAQGPGVYRVHVVATDDGTPPLTDEGLLVVAVREVNRPPVVAAIPDRTVQAGQTLTITPDVSDPDVPDNALRLTAAGPTGVHVSGGDVLWTPTAADVGDHRLTVTVTDDGAPRMSDRTSLTVTVTPDTGTTTTPAVPTPPATPGGSTTPAPNPSPAPGPTTTPTPAPTTPTPKPAPKPTPAPPHPKPGLTAAQSASRRLGSNLVPRLGQPGAAKGTAAGPRPRVTVSLQAPLRVLQSVGDLNVPVRLLSLGGAWTFLAAGLVVRRRRRPSRSPSPAWPRGCSCTRWCARRAARRCASCCAGTRSRCGRDAARAAAAAANGWSWTPRRARVTSRRHI